MSEKNFEAKTYEVCGLIRHDKSVHRDMNKEIEFVTLELRDINKPNLLKPGSNTPFLVITGRTAGDQAIIDKIKSCKDENGKFDPSKLGDQKNVEGLFARFPAPLHWQYERGEDGNLKYRKYADNHPDAGYRIPSEAVTTFIWANDLHDWEGVIKSMIPAGFRVKGDEKEVREYQYNSTFSADVMKKARAEHKPDKEGQGEGADVE